MKKLILSSLFTFVLLNPLSVAASQDPFLDSCLEAVNGKGYRGGGMQTTCEGYFILPSPLLIRCAKAMDAQGQVTDLALKPLCQIYCETNQYWGPWSDYPATELIAHNVSIIAEHSRNKSCD